MKVLILGGYGTFGGRLAQLLADDARITLLIAGRSKSKAAAFCARLPAKAALRPLRFDRGGDVELQLRAAGADIVVDATGPFQDYGDEPYGVVKAALATGTHYLDLADGSGFVQGVRQFDSAAQARGLFVLSGVSSFPVLTAAVVRHLSRGLQRLDTVVGGIAPSPYAGVGLNVIRAIAGYAGQKVELRRDGRPADGHALTEGMRCTIAAPGRLPLRNLRFSLVDVPDLKALPDLWPGLRTVWMGAGPVPEILHRALSFLSWLVRLRVVPSLAPGARVFYWAINVLRWGEHRGGMFVALRGVRADGAPVERSWHLLAEGDDGPLIPSMAAAAIIRKCLAGRSPTPGARPATTDLELADYEPLFARRTICFGVREASPETARWPLYRRILGPAWSGLPEPVRRMHDGTRSAQGVATVERGKRWTARLAAALFGFPRAGRNVPVTVNFESREGMEIWRRSFAGRSFSSFQSEGHGRSDKLLTERFGPVAVGLAVVSEAGRLRLVVRRWSVFGLPMPACLAPGGDAFEYAEDGRFHFHVAISHPLTGLIVRYRGWLVPQETG